MIVINIAYFIYNNLTKYKFKFESVIMARLRPARTCRDIHSQAWARFSLKKPRKNYVRSLPRTSLLHFNMGKNKSEFDLVATLDAENYIQLRSNSLESARQIINKFLETQIPGNYYMRVVTYPHSVIREHKMATGAGADRISQGMAHSFGRPVSIAARIKKGQSVLVLKSMKQNRQTVVHALKRGIAKLSGSYKIKINEIKK